jgi:hypothetical protein
MLHFMRPVQSKGSSVLEETYHLTPRENDSSEQLTKQNSEDLILLGDVSSKELLS